MGSPDHPADHQLLRDGNQRVHVQYRRHFNVQFGGIALDVAHLPARDTEHGILRLCIPRADTRAHHVGTRQATDVVRLHSDWYVGM